MEKEHLVPIIIPSYEPDERLIDIIKDLVEADLTPIVLVDDGSGDEYSKYFKEAQQIMGDKGVLLTHEVNKGKGRALKTAFSYILDGDLKTAIGAITADSDGQHAVECISKVKDALIAHPDDLILGVRKFDGADVPWKSRAGNTITIKVVSYISGLNISDTQTGLRGISNAFMKDLLDVKGERFEFETQMLLETKNKINITEVPIKTVYDSATDHKTHFDPWKDSIRIYKLFGVQFLKFLFASLSSCVLDLVLFAIFCGMLKGGGVTAYVAIATVIARVLSATYNYTINYKVVFKSNNSKAVSAGKYILLALVQMGLSALLVTLSCMALPAAPEVVLKAIIDMILFFISYYVQRKFIF